MAKNHIDKIWFFFIQLASIVRKHTGRGVVRNTTRLLDNKALWLSTNLQQDQLIMGKLFTHSQFFLIFIKKFIVNSLYRAKCASQLKNALISFKVVRILTGLNNKKATLINNVAFTILFGDNTHYAFLNAFIV
ncbi:hypothetical protein AKJ18_01720 [Vibrio xuii]|nr:hypothetical protein AKJ18_01720 [Vibrio xuii]